MQGIHRSPVNSPHKGQWRGALRFSLIRAWTNSWVNNRDANDLKRHRAHYYCNMTKHIVNPSIHPVNPTVLSPSLRSDSAMMRTSLMLRASLASRWLTKAYWPRLNWPERVRRWILPIGLLPDTQNCGLRMRLECRERFPRHRLQWKPLVSDPELHHGTCVSHVSWCMSGPLTRGGGENVPGIPGACATRNITYLVRGPCTSLRDLGHIWTK